MLEGEKKCTYFKKKIHGKWSIKGLKKKNYCWFASDVTGVGINRLCSATFEQLLASWATLFSTSNLGQLLPSLATFEQQIDIKPIQTIKGRFISKDFIKTGFIKTDFIKTKDIQ